MSSASTRAIPWAGSAISSRSRFAPAAWSSTPGSTPGGGHAQQAIEWFATTNGSGIEEVTSEVDRYCSWPGQACGYKVGHSEINRQRERTKAALGARYDLRRFNDTVVQGGNVPLDVLALNVDDLISRSRA